MRRHNLKPWAIEEPLCDINTTPMIDVMLVLITMLMLSLPPPTHEVPLICRVAATAPRRRRCTG